MEHTKLNSRGIRDLPEGERPRERLAELGESALSPAELLAILLRVGVEGMSAVQLGHELLRQFSGLRGLHRSSFEELCAVKGVGPAKAAQIKAAIELGHRLRMEEEAEEVLKFSNPESVNQLMAHKMGKSMQEELWVLALTTRNTLIRKQLLYRGTVNHSTARMAEIMEIPIRMHAAGVILVHNHPSGEHTPSPEDLHFTKELIKAGQLMDIAVLDHVIISHKGFTSIRRTGKVDFKSSNGRHWD